MSSIPRGAATDEPLPHRLREAMRACRAVTGEDGTAAATAADDELREALLNALADADFFDRAPVGLHSLDAEGRFVRINATELSWLGYSREEVVGRLRAVDLLAPESVPAFADAFPRLLAGETVRDVEVELVRKDGTLLPVQVTATPVLGPDGRFSSSRSIVVDQTEKRRAAAALREQARFIERVASATPDLVYVFDIVARRNVWANGELDRGFGYRPEELDAMAPALLETLIHPEDLPAVERKLERIRSSTGEELFESEYRMKDASGRWRWLRSRDVVFARDGAGRPTLVLGVAKDVTDQKETELALARSESFYRTLVETLPGGVAILDAEDRVSWASPRFLELFGARDEAGIVGSRLADRIAPESLQEVTERRRLLREEHRPAGPAGLLFLRVDGSTFPGVGSSSPLLEGDGRFVGSVVSVLDDSEKRRTELELRRREKFLEKVFHATPDAMYVFDLDERRVVFANRSLAALVGWAEAEAEAMGPAFLETILHPEDAALYDKRVERYEHVSDEDAVETLFRARHRDGSWRRLQARGVVFERSPDGRPRQVLAVVKDVTASAKAEETLRESEAFHRALAETVPVGIVAVDEADRIAWASPAFRELLGAGPDEKIAGSLLSERVSSGSEPVFREQRRAPREAAGAVRMREGRLRRLDGTELLVDVATAPLFTADGRFRGAILAARDVTERSAASGALRRSAERLQQLSRRVVEVQEEERRHLARELHDEIGQALAAIYFRMQALRKMADPLPREVLAETAEIADRTIRSVRDLSLDLHPPLLEESGLAETLRWYVDRQVRGPGLDVELVVCPSLGPLPPDLSVACFRIAQSALTNVVRHANAGHIRIEIGTRDGTLGLVVRDDGIGFDPGTTLPRATSGTSLGVRAMRERAELLGGSVTFASAPGAGTTVTALFPLSLPDAEEREP
jgi:PAS domain S-box-containing protein